VEKGWSRWEEEAINAAHAQPAAVRPQAEREEYQEAERARRKRQGLSSGHRIALFSVLV
jgi:hypothetical protein